MKIASIPSGGPVGFFRSIAPTQSLRERGHAAGIVHEQIGMPRAVQEGMIRTADLVSYVGPGRKTLFEDRPACFREMRGVLVVDYDDNPWAWVADAASRDPAHERMIAEANDPRFAKVDEHVLACVESWVQGADLVTTTTPELARVFREHGAREVAVCANGLMPGFKRQRPWPRSVAAGSVMDRLKRERAGVKGTRPSVQKRIGWTGTVAHLADLPPVLDALRDIMGTDGTVACLSLGPVKFTERQEWAGFRPPAYKQVLIAGRDGKTTDTVPFEGYFPTLEAMTADVAVIPMRASPLNAAKSDVTLLSWGIQGVPVVCSRFGAYADAERDGFPAIYVEHNDVSAWKREVRRLLYDRTEARALGDAAQAWVLSKRCFPEAVDPWELAFESACAKKGIAVEPARAVVTAHEES